MGELAMRAVYLAPLIGEPQDRVDLLRAQLVHRRPARLAVRQPPGSGALLPVPRTPLGQAKHAARLTETPARAGRLREQLQKPRLDRSVDAGWDTAYQPERVFPRNATNSIACSLTVSSSLAISARAA